jgi:hypothetical protein
MAKTKKDNTNTETQEAAVEVVVQTTEVANAPVEVKEGTTETTENTTTEVASAQEETVHTEVIVEEAATEEVFEPVIVEVQEQEVTEKLRSCVATQNHTCTIGGTAYVLTKDRTIQLPASVAAILSQARVIYIK